jgi:hypothetical protein
MANSIASLFGPSAEEIVYDRNQAERIRQETQLQQALAGQETQAGRNFYQSGYNITKGLGEGLAGMFGYSSQMEDPRIAQSVQARKIMADIGIEDLNDPGKLKILEDGFSDVGQLDNALYFADRRHTIEKEKAIRAQKQAEANKIDWKNVKEYVDKEGNVFRGGMNGSTLYMFDEAGNATQAPAGSISYNQERAVRARKIGKSQTIVIKNVLENSGYGPGIGELSDEDSDELNLRIASRANMIVAQGEQSGEEIEEWDSYQIAIKEFEDAGVLSKGKLLGFINTSEYNPKKPMQEQVDSVSEKGLNDLITGNPSSVEDPNSIEYDEAAGQQIGFKKDGTVVIVDKDGNVLRTTTKVLTLAEQKQLMNR